MYNQEASPHYNPWSRQNFAKEGRHQFSRDMLDQAAECGNTWVLSSRNSSSGIDIQMLCVDYSLLSECTFLVSLIVKAIFDQITEFSKSNQLFISVCRRLFKS